MLDGTTRIYNDGKPIYHYDRLSAFAEYGVVPEQHLVPIRKDAPLDKVCLIGCGVMTGGAGPP